jgi:DNA-cytosine methyltransferase
MKYISLFSGIGGFEIAINNVWPNAECLGYSEVKRAALNVYKSRFPDHLSLGDITGISKETLDKIALVGCDLLVAGFPCTNLSSLASVSGNHEGIQGPKSGLFFDLLRVIDVIQPKHIVIENNYSMRKSDRQLITDHLTSRRPMVCTLLDAKDFSAQCRKRLFWTTFPVSEPKRSEITLHDILDPVKLVRPFFASDNMVEVLNRPFNKDSKRIGRIAIKVSENVWTFVMTTGHNSKWDRGMISDTTKKLLEVAYPVGKSRPIVGKTGGTNNMIIDRRAKNGVFIRQFTPAECERLFGFDTDYTLDAKYKTTRISLLGNSVVVPVVEHVLQNIEKVRPLRTGEQNHQ